MRLATLPLFITFLTLIPTARAVLTLGLSTTTFTLTGIGPTSTGQGQSKITWGNCNYDGKYTTCTLSNPYTGQGSGVMTWAVTYTGNGDFPLIAITDKGSNLFSLQAVSNNYSFDVTVSPTGGTPYHLYYGPPFFITFVNPVCTGVTANCTADGVGQTPGATKSGLYTGTLDPAPQITPGGVISASNYGAFAAIAPATWIEIYGYNLATSTFGQTWAGTDFVNNVAPTALAGTTVTVAGLPAYIYYVTPGQINAQVPSGTGTGSLPVVVTTAGGASASYSIQVNGTEPGLLAPAVFILNGNQNVVALLNNTLTYDLPVKVAGVNTALAKPGDTLTMYGIGFGTTTPSILAGQVVTGLNALTANVQITIGGAPATVSYQGFAPGYVGLYQFNVLVPSIAANTNAPIIMTVNGAAIPQKLVIAIGN
jgi:uncharacterized protein (TIGR03437 family)